MIKMDGVCVSAFFVNSESTRLDFSPFSRGKRAEKGPKVDSVQEQMRPKVNDNPQCSAPLGVGNDFKCSKNIVKCELEEFCEDMDLSVICEKVEKNELLEYKYDDEMSQLCSVAENNKDQSIPYPKQTDRRSGLKRTFDSYEPNNNTKRPRHEEDSTSNDKDILVRSKYFTNHTENHVEIKLFKSNSSVRNLSDKSAFGQNIVSYKIKSKQPSLEGLHAFIKSIENDIFHLIDKVLKQHCAAKINIVVYAEFTEKVNKESKLLHFQTSDVIVLQSDNINIFMSSLCDTLSSRIYAFKQKNTCWSIKKIDFLELNINKFKLLRSSTYIELPKDIKYKHAVINVKSLDALGFKWALLSGLYPTVHNSDRQTSYSAHSNKLKFKGVSFPVKLNDVSKIEQQNNISINVFGLEFNEELKKHLVVGPLYFTKSYKSTHINLLYIQDGTNSHYCCIKNLSRLVRTQICVKHSTVFICNGCLLRFWTEDKLSNHLHKCSYTTTIVPYCERRKKNSTAFIRSLRREISVYHDFQL